MLPKERIIAVFEKKPVDRTPVMILDGGTWIADNQGMSLKDLYALEDSGAAIAKKTFEDMKSDTVTACGGAWLGWLNAIGCPVEMSKPGRSMEVSPVIDDPDDDIPLLDKSKIKEQFANHELVQQMINQTKRLKEMVGDEKLVVCPMPSPFTAANIMAGTENFMILMADESELINDLLDYSVECCATLMNMLCENGCDIIFICDPNASGDMISQTMYEDLVLPVLNSYIDKLQGYKYLCMHICGNTNDRLPTIKNIRISGFSVDSVVDIKSALDIIGENVAIIGNINPASTILLGTPEKVYNESMENLKNVGAPGRYILMPGCDTPAKSPIENIVAMTKAAEDYKY
jgi:Uroporphyrinogen-III decarboxylase